ncbi:leucine-rich repeat-containing protein 56 isoform X3 [Tamandua tetradactyla]|uniref:leucine-rich repeat-containing protein 56 isoform X3 n=1 Tax=Tamandua tetradactyla TaxID=48850 RepID=UPI004053946D
MEPAWDTAGGPRPRTPSIRVWELSWPGPQNPCPPSEGADGRNGPLLEEGLSPTRLALTQADDLSAVSMLELCVDTRECSLGSFGLHLPGLSQLKLNGSRLASIRDLGTSLGCLRVLWLARCGLADLDGVGSFPALKELYVSYNHVSDLSPLCLLEQLEVLDLEGNCVGELEQVRYLQLCPRLATLTLEGNLVCLCPGPGGPREAPQAYDYRAEVQKLVPQLQVLDDVPTSCTHPPAAGKLTQDGLLVTRAIRDSSALGGLVAGPAGCPHGAPQRQHHVVLSPPEAQPLSPGGLLPKDWAPKDDGSSLTHGVGRVLCGNPTRGLRERRDPGQALEPPRPLPLHGPEDCAARAPRPGPDPADNCSLRVLSEPWAWRDLRLQPLVSWPAGAAALQSPQRGPGNPEGKSEPETRLLRLAPAPAGGSGSTLVPSPPRGPMPPAARTSSWGPANLPLGGRRLRALRGLGPGSPGASWAQGPAPPLRTLAVAAGPSPHTQGYTAPNSTPEPPAGPLRGAQHLNPITAAHSHP